MQERVINELVCGLGVLNLFMGVKMDFFLAFKNLGFKATPASLAEEAKCSERYCREWLECCASHGYVEYLA